MDTATLAAYDAKLNEYLRLATFPVAVKFLKTWDEAPPRARRPARDLGNKFTTCQAIAMARRTGWTLALGREDSSCVLGAIAQKDIKRILSFHIVSQIGYMIMGLGFFTVGGVAAAIVFIVHQIIVKASLFLVGGLVEESEGTGTIDDIDGIAHKSPIIAALFLPAALSLAGFPPFSGFVGKLALVEAGFNVQTWIIVGISLVASLLTVFSMTKIWGGVFWGKPSPGTPRPLARGMIGATAGLILVSIVLAVGAQPLLEYAERAAEDLLLDDTYRDLVLGMGR